MLGHVETRAVRCPFAVAFGEHGDAARFCARVHPDPALLERSDPCRRAGNIPARGGAPGDSRPILYDSCELPAQTAPDGHAMDGVYRCLVTLRA